MQSEIIHFCDNFIFHGFLVHFSDLYQTEVNNSNETQILCGSGTLPDIDHVESQRCCNSSCEVFKTDISDQIIELCNWEPSCNLLTLNDTFSRSLVYNNTCVNQTSSLQTTIYHDCKRGKVNV